jgi:hypothetical protein
MTIRVTFSPGQQSGTQAGTLTITSNADNPTISISLTGVGRIAGDDGDGDGIPDAADNCPNIPNSGQADSDGDGTGNVCDTCPNDFDNDADGDGICGDVDNCPTAANADQADGDGDGVGDACDTDGDNGGGDEDGGDGDGGGGGGCFIGTAASSLNW